MEKFEKIESEDICEFCGRDKSIGSDISCRECNPDAEKEVEERIAEKKEKELDN